VYGNLPHVLFVVVFTFVLLARFLFAGAAAEGGDPEPPAPP
jgi:hypothetical protein